jgi:hypothetical protein
MANFRTRLKNLRDGLLRLHKTLLESERAAYERDVAPIRSSGHYLDLVVNDPWFNWLHELSRFVVVIDEAMARKEPPLGEEEALLLIARARTLVHPDEEGKGFARRYFEAMQRDPGTVLAHRDMLMVMDEL